MLHACWTYYAPILCWYVLNGHTIKQETAARNLVSGASCHLQAKLDRKTSNDADRDKRHEP